MMRNLWLCFLLGGTGLSLSAQKLNFFQYMVEQGIDTLEITMRSEIILEQKFVDTLSRGDIQWRSNHQLNSVNAKFSLRGKYRRRICSFPPIKLDLDKDGLEDLGLKKHDEYKLVTHCSDHPEQETYVRKEFLAYKIQQILLPYAYEVHYLTAVYRDSTGNIIATGPAILIENDKDLEDRLDLKEMNAYDNGIPVDSSAIQANALFQMLIANDDYDVLAGRNCKLFASPDFTYPVSYDFDFSGFVNADYARVNPNVVMHRLQDHLYLGPSFNEKDWKKLTATWLAKQEQIEQLLDDETILPKRESNALRRYVKDFMRELKKSPPLRTNDIYFFDN
ncbi:MAG: hypothetical protein KDC57_15105 [Saprospiraceae bacterium]|nr:hypothetical protein [Saprospiraceae bacterium]